MVRDAAPIGCGNFAGADIEMTVDLRGIADENFAAQAFGKRDAQRGFSRSGRPQNHYEPRKGARLTGHPEKAQ